MEKTTLNKNFSNTYIYKKSEEYEKKLITFIMTADRVDINDPSFEDVKFQIKRRQVTNILYHVLENKDIVLVHSLKGMPKAFKVFCGKDIRFDNRLKVYIDCSDIMKKINGTWVIGNNIDVLIAYLISALTNYIYYSEPTRLLMNSDIASYGANAFSSLFTYIVDYIYKISVLESKRDNCIYLSSMYYLVNILGKDPEATSTVDLAKRISKISDRQIDVLNMSITQSSYSNIKTFIETVAECLKLDKLTVDMFLEKWIFLYGTGTHFGTEYFPAFASMLTDTYVGCYINNQKTIEKISKNYMVDFTKTIFRIGEAVIR